METELEIAGEGASGICSRNPTTSVDFKATISSPGATSVYLLPKEDYDVAVLDKQYSIYYFEEYSCIPLREVDSITTCAKTATELPFNIICIAFRNDQLTTIQVKLTVDFADSSELSPAKIAIIVVLAVLFAIVFIILGYITLCSEKSEQAKAVDEGYMAPVTYAPNLHVVSPSQHVNLRAADSYYDARREVASVVTASSIDG